MQNFLAKLIFLLFLFGLCISTDLSIEKLSGEYLLRTNQSNFHFLEKFQCSLSSTKSILVLPVGLGGRTLLLKGLSSSFFCEREIELEVNIPLTFEEFPVQVTIFEIDYDLYFTNDYSYLRLQAVSPHEALAMYSKDQKIWESYSLIISVTSLKELVQTG